MEFTFGFMILRNFIFGYCITFTKMSSITIHGNTYGPNDAVPYHLSGHLPYNRTSAQAGFTTDPPKSWTAPYISQDQREKGFCHKACDCLGTVMDKGCDVCCGNPGSRSIFGKLSDALYGPGNKSTKHMQDPEERGVPVIPRALNTMSTTRARSASPFKKKQDGGKKKSRRSRKTRKSRKV